MAKGQVARASVAINVPITKVWDALVNPEVIKRYMFGASVVSDWREGSSIVWKGEWQGRPYQDKGVILRFTPERTLQYTHFSPQSGVPDAPENYHTVTVELSTEGKKTRVVLTQDNNPTEQARDHSERNWNTMLAALKKVLED
jgi:uncharacterized protein YndB with AHSA1/START domain